MSKQKLTFKLIDKKHEFEHKLTHISRIDKLIKYQNKILLYELANHFRWNYNELIDTYLDEK